MDAIVTAGGIPEKGEPLYEYTQGGNKALLDLGGKPMIQWVLDALSDAEAIENVVVIGLPETSGIACARPLWFVPNQGGMLENIAAGTQKVLEINPQAEYVLSVSSDIPAITPEMIDWMVAEASKSKHDIYYNVIERSQMENRFPGSRRSYTHLRDMDVCGGDMTVFRAALVTKEGGLWKQIIASRKNVFKQARLIGYGTLLLLLLRQLSLTDAVKRASASLQVNARAIVCPFPEVGMDVDKPYQLDIVRAELAQQTTP